MKDLNKVKNELRERRKRRVRARVSGEAKCPRISVFRSLKHLSVQAIDDTNGKTIVSVYDREVKAKTRQEKAKEIGKLITKKLLDKKISKAVFDKGCYKYHGLVKDIAEGAREEGLKF